MGKNILVYYRNPCAISTIRDCPDLKYVHLQPAAPLATKAICIAGTRIENIISGLLTKLQVLYMPTSTLTREED